MAGHLEVMHPRFSHVKNCSVEVKAMGEKILPKGFIWGQPLLHIKSKECRMSMGKENQFGILSHILPYNLESGNW